MPGLIGTTISHSEKDLHRAMQWMCYEDWHQMGTVLAENGVYFGQVDGQVATAKMDNRRAWVEGECYPNEEIPEKLLRAWSEGHLVKTLAALDGYFTAILYDSERKELLLISDRLGLKPLYVWQENGQVSWASELKALMALSTFPKKIDVEVMRCFLDLGYVAGNRTWFENVALLPAATIWRFDLGERLTFKHERYWEWSAVQPVNLTFDDAVDGLIEQLRTAVARRCTQPEQLGLSLSGGLDSRAILAFLPDGLEDIPLFTFGTVDCLDVQIARQVAEKSGHEHHVFPLSENNWLERRLEGVWRSDGFKNLLHLHFSIHQPAIRELCRINLNGFLGGVSMGAIYGSRYGFKRIGKRLAKKALGKYADWTDLKDPFYDLEDPDPFFIDQRIRRFSCGGSNEWSKMTGQRKPFADADLLSFIYSLPGKYRAYSRIFNAALLRERPELFREIPWQRTQIPISKSLKTRFSLQFHLPSIRQRLRPDSRYQFTRYPDWLRTQKAEDFFLPLLDPAESIYPTFLKTDFRLLYWGPHQQKKGDFSEQIGRAATLEYWLRRIHDL